MGATLKLEQAMPAWVASRATSFPIGACAAEVAADGPERAHGEGVGERVGPAAHVRLDGVGSASAPVSAVSRDGIDRVGSKSTTAATGRQTGEIHVR
nr:hypothetical protein [Streptomyces sp. 3213.3]